MLYHRQNDHWKRSSTNLIAKRCSTSSTFWSQWKIIIILTFTQINQIYSWSMANLLMTSSQATLANFETVWAGAQKALDECARQFQYERWPCPESILSNVYQNNLPINREIAFVQAIISAGIVHTVTKNCSTGAIDNCKCSKTYVAGSSITAPSNMINNNQQQDQQDGFRWGGCSDNVELGYKIAMAYLDDREHGRDLKAKIRLHNHHVGRLSVKETMVRKCKCHGVSGSCSMKTCWMKVNDFREIGNYLKKAYRRAVQIEMNQDRQQEQTITDVANWKLVYLEDSPDYCYSTVNASFGSTGTLGRKCSMRKGNDVSMEERKSCRRLCKQCGYRVKREKHLVTSSCNCKFNFCCEVQCQKCTKEEFTYVCSKPIEPTTLPSSTIA